MIGDNDDPINLDDFFYGNLNNENQTVIIKNKSNAYSLNDLLASSFSTYFLPLNHIAKKSDESILTLSKFKELNLNKVKEDMLYYCSPVDILSKLDINNSEYIFQESDYEFYNDLSIKTFCQRQKELIECFKDDEEGKHKIEKNKQLNYWKDSLKGKENQINNKKNEELRGINNLMKYIQNGMRIFSKEKNEETLLKALNEITSIFKKEKFCFEYIGYEMHIIIENNLIFLIGIIEKRFANNEELMGKLIGTFIDMNTYIKSNRLFFYLIQLLKKYNNISEKIKFDKNRQIISEESIDLSKIINSKETNQKIHIENIKEFTNSKGYKTNGKNSIKDDNFWFVNNKEELFIFSNTPNEKIAFFYKINIRDEEYDNLYELIDFGKIILSDIDDDLIFDINASIKDDLIYLCYLVNQKLNINGDAELKSPFTLIYKIYSTSMILLKEGKIKLDNFVCLKTYLYSDKKYLYALSDNKKIFILKKNYCMENYLYSEFSINSNLTDFSINDYKYHNCFNLSNLLLLENKNDKEELIISKITKKNDKYILNLIKMLNPKKEKKQEGNKEKIRYKLSYNDNSFLIIKIDSNSIFCSEHFFNENHFIQKGIQFLPFDNSSIDYSYNDDYNSQNIYKDLLKEYSIFVNLYGNFDIIGDNTANILLYHPYFLCFNINNNNFNFIIQQILSNDVDIEIKYYYFIIVKQYICSLYNLDNLKIEEKNKFIEYMKQFILDININHKDNKYKKYINKITKEIIFISSYLYSQNIIEIQDIKNIFKENDKLDFKTKFLLLDLLLTQPKTQQNTELFNFIFEFDKSFLLYIFASEKDKIIKNKFFSSNYQLYKNIMNKALVLMNNYFKNNSMNIKLFSLTEIIANNIEEICKVFQEFINSELFSLPIFFISINFTMLYLILQRLISNTSINKNMKIISSLYNLLIIFDKLNINKKIEKCFDLNNLIEIKNYFFENDENSLNKDNKMANIINFTTKQNIIFKTNITDINNNDDYMTIQLIKKSKNKKIKIKLNEIFDYIHYDVDGVEVTFNKAAEKHEQFILNIIPIKDEKEYLKNRNNDNLKIINLFQKTILYYFLYLFEKIDEKINDFNKDQNIKNFCKLYHTEFLQFICTDKIDIDMNKFSIKKEKKKEKEKEKEKEKKKDEKEEKKEEKKENIEEENENIKSMLYKSTKLINSIDNLFYKEKNDEKIKDKSSIQLICDEFISLFGNLNNKENNYLYKKDDKTLQKIKSYKDINLSDSSFIKLIELYKSEMAKKNRLLSTIKSNDSINAMILKIFQIIVKFYNYNEKLLNLIGDIQNCQLNENYKLFYEIYEECCKMKMVYNQEKNRFVDEKFEEQSQNYINLTMAKLEFIYKIIIPSFDETLKYDKSIVNSLIDLIKNQNFSPKEIIEYSEIQNLNCSIKLIELLIINNLLINLKEEENLRFILYRINDKYNKNLNNTNYSISISFFDFIYGADFSKMEQVKNQFHLLIEIIIDKYISNSNIYENLSLTTKISLYQCLLWKYKGRDFNIIPKIINCFEDLKKCELLEDKNNDILFKLDKEKIYRINNFNIITFNNMKFEIFKIIASQILIKIKENLNNSNIIGKDVSLNIKRNISNINLDYKNIISLVISYFAFIKKTNKYYQEFILFFYKNLINSKKLIEFIIDSYPEVIIKIFDILFDNNNINNNQSINIKLILLKLLFQILENINSEDKIACLIDCCMQYDKDQFNDINNKEEPNPFHFLMSKFSYLLNKDENKYLKYYYFKIFLYCLNKIDIEKCNIDKTNLLDINLLLSSNNNISKIEPKFYIKNEYGEKFNEIALFCHLEANKEAKSGNLLCYIDNESLFNNYLTNNDIEYFNYKDFVYNVEQNKNSENIFVIMDESLDGKINKIKSLEKRNIKDITLIDNKKSNLFYSNYLQNNSKYIYDNLIAKLIENKLNYKGINYILKLIYNLLDYITSENANKTIKYIFQFINDENVIKNEKEWNFCSFEYFINEMNSFQNIFDYSAFNILNENKKKRYY